MLLFRFIHYIRWIVFCQIEVSLVLIFIVWHDIIHRESIWLALELVWWHIVKAIGLGTLIDIDPLSGSLEDSFSLYHS